MTIYKQRGTMKRWTVMLACLIFAFVIVGTFITRSGVVQSVHAFEENTVALVLFGIMVILAMLVGFVGLILRRKTFVDGTTASDEAESIMSKDVAYYLNNVVMVVCMVFLMYMTLSSALPGWLPFGGQVLKAPAFNAIARPVGVLFCFILAACPLLAWKKTSAKNFFKLARIPAIGALILFILLCVYFVNTLLPTYMLNMAQGGTNAEELLQAGPFFYYAALTLVGFLAASLLFFNALFMLIRAISKRNLRVQTIGGALAHMSIGIMIIGFIGSSMYTYERVGDLANPDNQVQEHGAVSAAPETFTIKNYTISFVDRTVFLAENGDDILYTLVLEVKKNGVSLGQVSPQAQLVQSTGQMMYHAAVITQPLEDFFIVYRADTELGDVTLDVRVNPLMWFVWLGFGFLMLGTAIAAIGRRKC